MEQLNYDLIYDFPKKVLLIWSVENPCIQKYVKRKTKASLRSKLLCLLLILA